MRFRLRGFNNTNKAIQLCNSLFRRGLDRLDRNKQKLRDERNGPRIAVINDYSPSLFGWFFNRPNKSSLHQCTTTSNRQCNCTGKCPDLNDSDAGFSAVEGGVYYDLCNTTEKERREKRSKYEQLKRNRVAARIKAKRKRERARGESPKGSKWEKLGSGIWANNVTGRIKLWDPTKRDTTE
jgi:hypothetical protein